MDPRERIHAALRRQATDRIPRFEVWIDGLYEELNLSDRTSAYAELGQDAVLLPSCPPPESSAWKTGVDEWGRVWKNGMYTGGALDHPRVLARFSPPPSYAQRFFDPQHAARVRTQFPKHCLFFGTHAGPFMNAYMAMGLERFCLQLGENPAWIRALLERRTEWCLALFSRAVELGAELIVMGDDSAHGGGPMISPRAWREFILPCHRQIVQSLPVPVIWHSDGNISKLLPMAVEAGFAGIHGLEPWSMSLPKIKAEWGEQLVLCGNADVRALCSPDLAAVRAEVQRCAREGGQRGYMLSSCNSIFPGMHPDAVREFFRCQADV